MPGPTTEVLNEDIKTLRADLHQIATSLAEFHGEIRGQLKIIIGLAQILIVTVITGAAAAIWWGGTITAEVRDLSRRVGQVESRLGSVEVKLGQVEVEVAKVARPVPK
jgi:hypothetical protein